MKIRWMLSLATIVAVAYLIAGQAISIIQSNADVSTGWINRRYALAMDAFTAIQGHSVIFLGSSEVESGVRPSLFNSTLAAAGIKVTGYNFGFRNMSPRNLGEVILQMKETRHPNLKVEAIYLKFSPSDLTIASQIATETVDDEVAANVHSNSYLMRHLSESSLKSLVIKNFQGGFTNVNLNDSVRFFGLRAIGGLTHQQLRASNELDTPRYQLWIDRRYNAAPEWSPSQMGFHDRAADALKSGPTNDLEFVYKQQREPKYLKFNFAVHERRSEVISLRMSPKLISEFQMQLEALFMLSDNVVLFYYPDHPNLPRTSSARSAAESLFKHFCSAPSLRCLRFDSDGTFTADDYYDTSHLIPAAADRLTQRLADDFMKTKGSHE